MRTSLQNGVDAATHYLSLAQAVEASFNTKFIGLPDPVLSALLTLYTMQVQKKPCRIIDMFPGLQVSDRTRLLYIRLMVQRGLLAPAQPSCNSKSDITISDVANEALVEILNIWRFNSTSGCLDLAPY